jgi:GxxExxY protein
MTIAESLKRSTGEIVDAALKLHIGLGPGLLESVYQSVLTRDLARRGMQVESEKCITFEYDGMRFDSGLRLDLLIDRTIVLELKSVEAIAPVHTKQVLTYLRLLHLPVGLLLNFGAPLMKEGIRRVLNGYPPIVNRPNPARSYRS